MPKTLTLAQRERAEAILAHFETSDDYSAMVLNKETGATETLPLPPVETMVNPALRLVMAYFQDALDETRDRLAKLEKS